MANDDDKGRRLARDRAYPSTQPYPEKVEGTASSPWPTTRPAAYDANTPPKITTSGPDGRWGGPPAQIGGWPGGPGLKDTGKATKAEGIAKAKASQRQGAVEQKY